MTDHFTVNGTVSQKRTTDQTDLRLLLWFHGWIRLWQEMMTRQQKDQKNQNHDLSSSWSTQELITANNCCHFLFYLLVIWSGRSFDLIGRLIWLQIFVTSSWCWKSCTHLLLDQSLDSICCRDINLWLFGDRKHLWSKAFFLNPWFSSLFACQVLSCSFLVKVLSFRKIYEFEKINFRCLSCLLQRDDGKKQPY